MCHTVVDLTVLNGSHTGKRIAKSFWYVLKEFGISEKLLSATADNASNMDTMFEELESLALAEDVVFDPKNYRIRCFAHIMNLACKDMIQSIGDCESAEYDSDSDSDDKQETNSQKELPVVTKLLNGGNFLLDSALLPGLIC